MAELETPTSKKQKRCHLLSAIYNYMLQGTAHLRRMLRILCGPGWFVPRALRAPPAPELCVRCEMKEPTENFNSLLNTFNIKSKKELEKHCSGLTVCSQDLVALILGAQHGVLSPYIYANHFSVRVPDHLNPSEEESSAIAENGVGPFKTRESQKFSSKIFQLFREKRHLSAHLFYTPSKKYWHIIYFDNRDLDKRNNHWKHGPHIHYISDLWAGLSLKDAWNTIHSGKLSFPNKIHIRYIDDN